MNDKNLLYLLNMRNNIDNMDQILTFDNYEIQIYYGNHLKRVQFYKDNNFILMVFTNRGMLNKEIANMLLNIIKEEK